MSKKIITEQIEATLPNKELSEFYETQEGKVLKHIADCLDNQNIFEAYFFMWAYIEQILVRQLITFISKNLKVDIPKSFWKSNQLSINNFYLALSQDKELFTALEAGRKKRNDIVHQLVDTHTKGLVNKKIKQAIKNDNKTMGMIFDRLTGVKHIPSLALYSNGWNDCVKKVKDNINRVLS